METELSDQESASAAQPTLAETEAPGSPRRGPLAPLRSRNFSLLFSGQFISVLGDQAYALALPWTVLTATGDPRQMAIVLAAEVVPRVIFLLLGGVLADRLNPRSVMLFADVGRALVVGALGVTLFFGLPPLWIVAVLAGLQGVCAGLFMPGSFALLPRTVAPDDLAAGNGLMQMSQFLTLTIGPLLGGVATAAQASVAFLADAASFVVSAFTLLGIRLPERATPAKAVTATAEAAEPSAAKGGVLRDINAGINYAVHEPLMRVLMTMTIVANFAIAGTVGVSLVVLSQRLSGSPITLGILTAATGVGGVLGGLGAGFLGRARRRGVVAMIFWIFMACALAAVPLVAAKAAGLPAALDPQTYGLSFAPALDTGTQIIVAAALLGVTGFILAIGDTMLLTIMQQRIAPEYLARVFSVQLVAGGVTQPLSLILAGLIAATLGAGVAFLGSAALIFLVALYGFSSRELRTV